MAICRKPRTETVAMPYVELETGPEKSSIIKAITLSANKQSIFSKDKAENMQGERRCIHTQPQRKTDGEGDCLYYR